MRRFLASLLAGLSLAALPALALADSPPTPHDCARKCDCVGSAHVSLAAPTQEPSDWVKTIWISP